MNCPVCDGRLRVVERYGVEIDVCPECKGVWLDRGELEKIVAMVDGGAAPPDTQRRAHDAERVPPPRADVRHKQEEDILKRHRVDEHYRGDRERDYDYRTGKRRRKEGFLGEIFDLFGGD